MFSYYPLLYINGQAVLKTKLEINSMEENEEKPIPKIDGLTFLNIKDITVLDLSNKNLSNIDENVPLPSNLTELYLAHNKLDKVPAMVLSLGSLKILNISFNNIKYFDDTPYFYKTIECLDISNNRLLGPPYWMWLEETKNLKEVNLSCNNLITHSFINAYFEELLQYKCLVTNIILYNCSLNNHLKLLSTFPKVKHVTLGTIDLSYTSFKNFIEEVPCVGLDECCDIETLNLSNTGIYSVKSNIVMYTHLKEINLSLNKLSDLPTEFSNLNNLEVCILSCNNLLYLPDNFNKLERLVSLYVNSNCLCMLPNNLCDMPCLRILDLYDNNLNDLPNIENFIELDLAQNYLEEPINQEYIEKKEKIRLKNPERYDGRKLEVIKPESVCSINNDFLVSSECEDEDIDKKSSVSSSEEDWDSDEYWIPHVTYPEPLPQPSWLLYVKQKMAEGNFCPMDAHQPSVADKVRYEKLCYPREEYETDGQFDDFSGDDS